MCFRETQALLAPLLLLLTYLRELRSILILATSFLDFRESLMVACNAGSGRDTDGLNQLSPLQGTGEGY